MSKGEENTGGFAVTRVLEKTKTENVVRLF